MIGQSIENPLVSFSVRVYKMLLVAYPARFQQEYGPHMVQVFRDCCLRAFRRSGTGGLLKLWAPTSFDLLRSSLEEHLQKETFMTRSKFIRLSGWSLILGGVTFLLFGLIIFLTDGQSDESLISSIGTILITWLCPVLFGVGLLGLRTRYGDNVGAFSKNILLVGAVAGLVTSIAGTVIPFIVGNGSVSWAWLLLYTGNAVVLASLSIFGIAALRAKPFSRWNGLPLLAGICYPVLIVLAYVFEVMGLPQTQLTSVAVIAIALQGVLVMVMGYMLQSNLPEDYPAPAEAMP
jgi:hypothetical protein